MAKTHYFPSDQVHFTWDAGNAPVLTVDSGDTVVVHTRDVSDDQIGPDSTVDVIAGLDWDRVYPLAGPIAVDGAAARRHAGRRGPRPPHRRAGAGRRSCRARAAARRLPRCLPADLRPHRRRRHLLPRRHRDPDRALLGHDGRVPRGRERAAGHAARDASAATWTPASSRAARRSTCPSRSTARSSAAATPTRAQGDGEVCVTGLESPMYGALRFTLHKDRPIPAPQYLTGGPLAPRVGRRALVRDDRRRPGPLRRRPGGGAGDGRPSRRRARPLAGGRLPALQPCVDLRISEIVDAGQYVVSALLPLAIFSGA